MINSVKNNPFSYTKNDKIKLSKTVKGSFNNQSLFKLYRSLLTGEKRGLNKELKAKFKRLQLIHLMTPSGLHFSAVLIILLLIRKRYDHIGLDILEISMCLLIYFFLPGYFSLKRVAFLRALFLVNKKIFKYSIRTTFFLFLIIDYFWGTYQYSPLSFLFSSLFLGCLFVNTRKNPFKLALYFFISQSIIAYCFNEEINVLNLFFSPFLTYLFTAIYPLLFGNILFIHLVNYSEVLLSLFTKLILLFESLLMESFERNVTFMMIFGILIMNRKTILLSASLLIISISIH